MSNPNKLYLLFEKAARLYPDDNCIVSEKEKLTYKQVEEEVTKVSRIVLFHAKEEEFIGIPTTRCIEQIIFVLAVLKSGKAYLPIDFGYPKQRLESMINNSKLTFCLTTKFDEPSTKEIGLFPLLIEKLEQPRLDNDIETTTHDLATYILYTSGSTGEPKGVCMGEKAMVNLINWQHKNSSNKNNSRTLQFAPLSFDVSFQEIMSTLTIGGTLVLISNELRLDMVALLNYINDQQVNRLFLPFVALQALAETAISTEIFPTSLNEVMTAGEQLKVTSQVRAFFNELNDCVLYNQYGPTECHVVTELKLDGKPENWPALPSIGKPISNTSIFILDKNQEIVLNGNIGELCIAGDCLAKGYLNNEALTDEKFVRWKSPNGKTIRIYRTGDIAKYLSDGNIEFLGRKDDQVKISGHRIELAEVELAINSLPGVHQTVVISSNHSAGQTQLVAYIQPNTKNYDVTEVRKNITDILPDYMVPSYFVPIENFPRTSSGKIDKKNLPPPQYSRPSSAPLYKKPITKIQKNLAKVWSSLLHVPKVGIDDNFFEFGGTSLLAQKVVAILLKDYDYKLPVTKLYQFPTIAGISNYLEPKSNTSTRKFIRKNKNSKVSGDIAVIGMAGRFPGANSIPELWEVLRDGRETITFFTPEELDPSIPETLRNDSLYVPARGIIPIAKEFDAAFFGLNPKIAEAMDPQQRLFLEIAWEVLEQSGHLSSHFDGRIGVYAGTGMNTYYKNNILPNKKVMDRIGSFLADTFNEKDYIASRIAYQLNLKGPAVSVHSACSTSSLAIAHAVEAIRNGQCDVALAGGSSVTAPIHIGHLYQDGSIMSPDGHCRPFDENARGTIFSDGAGVVLLKRLKDAERDGDIIHGVIKGIGINNDGGNKGSFTAPSTEGQSDAISLALLDAEIDPSDISYIETHGTATPVGDPIEIEGLKMAFGEQAENGFCAIGSIKSNMGHLTGAAGVSGVIKTILALKNRQIPASLGFEKPNPSIDFENSPFYVNNKLSQWNSKSPRKAGISSFGVGGTNVHIVVEEYENNRITSDSVRSLQLLTWSAKSEHSLVGYQKALGEFLEPSSNISLSDIAHSLICTREEFAYRSFAVAENIVEAKEMLLCDDNKHIKTNQLKEVPSELAFLFPGQGSQYLQMGKSLYDKESVFKNAVDQCAELLKADLRLDIREIIYPEVNSAEAEEKLKDTKFTQPALFVIEYALSQLWMNWGIKPTLLCGHSIGEFVAAHLAGIFSLEDALHLITMRGRLVSELPGGSMLSIRSTMDEVKNLIPDNLSIAAINSDRLIVISGPDTEIEYFSELLNNKNIANKLLLTSHAFHSKMMDPVLDVFESEVKKVTLNVPRLPIVSTVTGTWLTDAEAISSTYWTNHLRAAVNFSGAMETVLGLEDPVLLEIGPGRALSTLSMQKKGLKSLASIASLSFPKENQNAHHTILSALGELWVNGIDPNWTTFYGDQISQKVWLPAYVFDRKPCWINPLAVQQQINTIENIAHLNTEHHPQESTPNTNITLMRKPIILNKITKIIEDNSGIEIESSEFKVSFLELGLDSLVLTQMAINLKNEFNTPITFRQLNDEFGSPDLLAEHLDNVLPKEVLAPTASSQATANNVHPITQNITSFNPVPQDENMSNNPNQNTALSLIAQQLQLLGQQIQLLQGNGNATPSGTNSLANTSAGVKNTATVATPVPNAGDILSEDEKKEHQKPFGASPKIEKLSTELFPSQKLFLERLIASYNKKTAASKAYTQKHRSHMSDPRVVSGFKPLTKELVYPIVVEKSSGNRLWDIDGNEYIDTLNGFGSCMFGHQPEFITKALKRQIDSGYEVGPQHPLAGEVCELLCEFTNHDRAALCNTGSEAVLGAMRIARTVTGRSLIVTFSGSYHGINDEGLVRGSKKLKTFPATAGIISESVQNVLVLEYGTDESLEIIRSRSHELAAVLVEPVQSRRPEFQPVEFLKEVREITKATETVLIFDEVITGFRMHPGGAQALFGIKADIGTYGKVIGGGISIGAIVGKRKYMDALDGGFWQYGDNSYPEIGVTYFAGTFVRHPLALAAAKASLIHMRELGESLQKGLNLLTENFAKDLNKELSKRDLPMEIKYFGSLWRLKFLEEIPYSELLFVLMREKGFHIWDGFPCFITSAFEKEDIKKLIHAFVTSVDELIAINIFDSKVLKVTPNSENADTYGTKTSFESLNTPPVEGAKLGLDEAGNPAWYIADENNNGSFLKIKL